ncbi:hypothetical protein QAD02_019394 [Eretmocerus hayati]|uniref:Uncharacterized protein n=1 Tax=Eretmocerus hayati TaxID=131215 RepID=A0ACC2PJP8_9HYME|nr:hypothetical protein QAD02_019394 [Eretmocerus hayati]
MTHNPMKHATSIREDKSLLAQFFFADESLNGVACELDSFDGRQEPERCTSLVNQLRHCQDKVLTICNQIMDELIPESRANRDFRVKFPDDVMQENLAGQLWFGAECLAAGSSILNREAESSAMRPLAKALTKSLEIVRNLLREHALRGQTNLKAQNPLEPSTEKLIESLKIFDRLFADFELSYVGAMVPVKSTKEYEQQELVCVLFSETLQRALERGLLSQGDVDNYEPALMFTIPRLAIVAGLLAPPTGPLCLNSPDTISEMFRPFRSLLLKIRELLWTLNNRELYMLEKLLCSMEDAPSSMSNGTCQDVPDLEQFVHNFYTGYPNCKDFISDFYHVTRNNGNNMDEVANDAVLIIDQDVVADSSTSSLGASASRSITDQRKSPATEPSQDNDSISSSRGANGRHDSSGSSDFYSCDSVSVEIPQTQDSLEASSWTETTTIADADDSTNRLVDVTNKSLSNLLLDAECSNEISEHTDSGICTVISSENTSLYDKSPEEKLSLSNELEHDDHQQNQPGVNKNDDEDDAEEEENTSYSCSSLSSPQRRDSTKSDGSCVCSGRVLRAGSAKPGSLMASNLENSNEEIIGLAYGSGQIPVCDGNPQQQQQSSFQVNYSENWEKLKANIEASSSRREFWNELKGENKSQQQPRSSRRKDDKQRRRHHRRKYEHSLAPSHHYDSARRRSNLVNKRHPTGSTESSRSSSIDRCGLNQQQPRLVSFGSSLHPSQNSRQMPSFGAASPRFSPRMQHFEQPRGGSGSGSTTTMTQGKKLLDHRRCKTDQHHLKTKRRSGYKLDHFKRRGGELINDGLGPRTNKSGIVTGAEQQLAPGRGNEFAPMSSSSCSSCCDSSSETSEFHSDCQDDEEIALAMQAAEIANRNKIRSKFRSSEDLVHRLFVCIAGVADQLQTNFASDLRNILKCVFLMNSSQGPNEEEKIESPPPSPTELEAPTSSDNSLRQDSVEDDEGTADHEITEERSSPVTEHAEECVERVPVWVPDSEAPRCMACDAGFTVVRRRHHCRNCGKVFCGRCSSNSVPLPRFGHTKPVRVCNRCFLYQVTPFTVSQDGGSEEGEASTSGSSAGSVYCTLEQDFARITSEMKMNDALAAYEAEYTRLFESLYKAQRLEEELTEKCQTLQDEVTESRTKVSELERRLENDVKDIEKLKNDVLLGKQMADAAHIREQRAQEVIENLRVSIAKLTDEVDLKNKQLAQEEQTAANKQSEDASKDREGLINEIEALRQRVHTLTGFKQELESRLNDAEQQTNKMQEMIDKQNTDAAKDKRERDKIESELHEFEDELRMRLAELQTVQETLRTTSSNAKKQEERLKEQVDENEKSHKEIQRLTTKQMSMKAEIDKANQKNDRYRKEIMEKNKFIQELSREILKLKEEVGKMRSDKENAYKKLTKEIVMTAKTKENNEQLARNLKSAEFDIETLKKQMELEKKSMEKQNREKEVLMKNFATVEDINKKFGLEIRVYHQTNRKLEATLEEMTESSNDMKRQLKNFEKERDRLLIESQDLAQKVEDYMDEVKLKRLEMTDYQKQLAEAEAKQRQQLSLFEDVRAERNTYKKALSASQEENNELKTKVKNMNLQMSQLEGQLLEKGAALQKQEFLYGKSEKERESLSNELEQARETISKVRRELNESHSEEKRLRNELQQAESNAARQNRELDAMMNERDMLGAQIVRRNDELALQRNQIQLLNDNLSRGEKQYAQRQQEIRQMKIELTQLRSDKANLQRSAETLADVRAELFRSERQLATERMKVVALEEELQSPLNVHRWRNLEGTDPETFELLKKIHLLQRRILNMSSEMITKDKKIKETEKMYMNLREIVAKQPGPEVLMTLNQTRRALKDRGKKMKCLIAEMNMTLATEHKFEIEKMKKELSAMKMKYLAQKRKETKSKEPTNENLPPVPENSQKFLGGGFSLCIAIPKSAPPTSMNK